MTLISAVEKELFLDLAKNYTSLTIEEALAVDELQLAYPYSQVVHCLATRGAQDHRLENSKALLGLSAVYATDRSVLRLIMTAPRTERRIDQVKEDADVDGTAELPVVPAIPDEPVSHAIPDESVAAMLPDEPQLSGDALNEEIMRDLMRLQELKVGFEESFIEFTKVNPPGTKGLPVTKVQPPAPGLKPTIKKEEPQKPPSTIVKPAVKKEEPPKPPVRLRRPEELRPEPTGEALIDEIASSRKRMAPESESQKEQLEIIDQFISKQPRIQRPTAGSTPAEDLAENSTELTDSMVSETLVEILLRQGKKERAVEVLRKLIWKFPQKKAIFAAQIDELKK